MTTSRHSVAAQMMPGFVRHHPGDARDRETAMPRKTTVEANPLPTIQHEGLRVACRRRPEDVETDIGETRGEAPDDPFDPGAMPIIQ